MVLAATVTETRQFINWTIKGTAVIVVLGIMLALDKIRFAFEVATYTIFTIATVASLWTLIIARTESHAIVKIAVTLQLAFLVAITVKVTLRVMEHTVIRAL